MEPEEKSTSFAASNSLVTEPTVTTEAPPAPRVPKKGVYVLEPGDSPGVVSHKLFGRGNRAVDLFRANPDCDWAPGSEITIP